MNYCKTLLTALDNAEQDYHALMRRAEALERIIKDKCQKCYTCKFYETGCKRRTHGEYNLNCPDWEFDEARFIQGSETE